MPRDVSLRCVRSAAEAQLQGIIVTGGEPFVEYDLLLDVIREAGRLGLASRVVTNAFWATTPDRARALIEPLSAAGLRTLTVSSDEMHESHVLRARVQTAVRTGLEMGLRVIVSSAVFGDHPHSVAATILDRLEIPPHPMLWLKCGFVSPNGRAAELQPTSFDVHDALAAVRRLDAPCPFVVTEPVVTPSGDLAVCCSPATATRVGFRPEFVIGNLTRTPYFKLQEALEQDPVFLLLMLRGPFQLYQLAEEVGAAPDADTSIVNQCDLCAAVLRDQKILIDLRHHLISQTPSLLAQALHMFACAGGNMEQYLERQAGLHQSTAPCCSLHSPSKRP